MLTRDINLISVNHAFNFMTPFLCMNFCPNLASSHPEAMNVEPDITLEEMFSTVFRCTQNMIAHLNLLEEDLIEISAFLEDNHFTVAARLMDNILPFINHLRSI